MFKLLKKRLKVYYLFTKFNYFFLKSNFGKIIMHKKFFSFLNYNLKKIWFAAQKKKAFLKKHKLNFYKNLNNYKYIIKNQPVNNITINEKKFSNLLSYSLITDISLYRSKTLNYYISSKKFSKILPLLLYNVDWFTGLNYMRKKLAAINNDMFKTKKNSNVLSVLPSSNNTTTDNFFLHNYKKHIINFFFKKGLKSKSYSIWFKTIKLLRYKIKLLSYNKRVYRKNLNAKFLIVKAVKNLLPIAVFSFKHKQDKNVDSKFKESKLSKMHLINYNKGKKKFNLHEKMALRWLLQVTFLKDTSQKQNNVNLIAKKLAVELWNTALLKESKSIELKKNYYKLFMLKSYD